MGLRHRPGPQHPPPPGSALVTHKRGPAPAAARRLPRQPCAGRRPRPPSGDSRPRSGPRPSAGHARPTRAPAPSASHGHLARTPAPAAGHAPRRATPTLRGPLHPRATLTCREQPRAVRSPPSSRESRPRERKRGGDPGSSLRAPLGDCGGREKSSPWFPPVLPPVPLGGAPPLGTGHGRYPVPVEVHSQAAGEAGQEGREGLQGRANQSEEGSSAEECGVCACVCRERHPQEERGRELAPDGVPCGRCGLQGPDGCDHERGDEEHGTGGQGPGQGSGLHGPAEGLRGDGQVRAAGPELGRSHVGDGGLHELGYHPDHASGAGGQPHRADRRGERPGGHGPAQPAARGRLCCGRELHAEPGGPAVTQAGGLEELAGPCAQPRPLPCWLPGRGRGRWSAIPSLHLTFCCLSAPSPLPALGGAEMTHFL